jgi:ABC-2 type transport system ATP-binding protein|tara:strand:- start:1867 stop:2298 length:432 start_codon:yes stop_codon:yes gene_type:complete
MVKEENITVILTTHYMEEADMLCDRVGIIDLGKIVVLDSPNKLKRVVGGDLVRLRISKPNLEKVRKLGFVKNVDFDDSVVTLKVIDANIHLQEILDVIGLVESVEMRSPTLNDVFLHYTGRQIREEAPEGGFYERVATHRSGR